MRVPDETDSETNNKFLEHKTTMDPDYDTSSNSSTNWYIADGSLLNSVTFESSDQQEPALDSAPKSPLILRPTSLDSGPCEITITFAQSHEVRQVYVRSTARVFEIYYAPKRQSDNEYLCTVRCGVAYRDEEVLQAANFDESALARLKGVNRELDGKRLKNARSSSSNEDDWVEVKAPVLDSGSNVPSNSILNLGSTQDLYEATAEINDANPCTSITLRLLSLQNKGCLCVDEVYVFADPVDVADSENEVGQMGNTGGNSLMAMLPTLLQLSKTTGLRRIENEEAFGTKTKEKKQENGSKAIEPLNFRNEIQQEVKPSLTNQQNVDSQEASAATIEPNQHEISPLKHGAAEVGSTCGNTDILLNELVSRVSRVEDLLLKFEENMLKPISSIDARLQRVEQQLGELTKNPKNSELPPCTRFSAPELSCHDSDNYSSCNIGNESSLHDIDASNEKDISLPNQLDETIYSVNATRSCPTLVVTAPDYSTADDEEDDHAPETGSPEDKPKQTVSIDDALASALANFLYSTSLEPEKYTQALAVKAPDFLPEVEGSIDKKVSPESHFQETSKLCCFDTRDEMNPTTASVPSVCSFERIGEVTCSLNDDDSEQAANEEDCQNQGPCHDTVDCIDTLAEQHQIAEDMGNVEVSNTDGKILVFDEIDILNQFLENHIDDASDTDVDLAPGNKEIKAEVAKQGSQEEFLQIFLELSYASSMVDFETPILDVKFTSQDKSNNKSPLESLLCDMQVTDTSASCSKKSDGSQLREDCNMISVEEGEPSWPVTDQFSVDLGGVPLNSEVVNLEDYRHACSNQEVSVVDGEPDLHDSVDLDGCLTSMPLNLEVKKLDYPACSNHELGVIRIGKERYTVWEALFQPSMLGLEAHGIVEQLVCSIATVSSENQKQLLENTILCGGTTSMTGFESRFQKEASLCSSVTRPSLDKPPEYMAENLAEYSAWVGGAILAKVVLPQNKISM